VYCGLTPIRGDTSESQRKVQKTYDITELSDVQWLQRIKELESEPKSQAEDNNKEITVRTALQAFNKKLIPYIK
jgi:hypothetical protein